MKVPNNELIYGACSEKSHYGDEVKQPFDKRDGEILKHTLEKRGTQDTRGGLNRQTDT